MAQPKSILKVSGLVFNATDYINLGSLDANGKFTMSYDTLSIPYSDRIDSKTAITGRKCKFEGKFRQLTPAWFARFTGGSLATGALKYARETITRSANTITLANGAGGTQSALMIVRCYDITNKTERAKDTTAVANETYTLATKILTVDAADSGTVFEVTYLYADSAPTTSKIIVPSQSFPGSCRLLLTYQLVNLDDGTTQQMVIDCAKALYTGPFELGGNTQEYISTPANFDILNEVDGDLVFYSNGYNPKF